MSNNPKKSPREEGEVSSEDEKEAEANAGQPTVKRDPLNPKYLEVARIYSREQAALFKDGQHDLRKNAKPGHRIYTVSPEFFAEKWTDHDQVVRCREDLPKEYYKMYVPVAVPNFLEHWFRGLAINDFTGYSYLGRDETKSYDGEHLYHYDHNPNPSVTDGLSRWVRMHANGSFQVMDKNTGPGMYVPLSRGPPPNGPDGLDYRNWFRQRHVLYIVRGHFFYRFYNTTYPTVPGGLTRYEYHAVVVPNDHRSIQLFQRTTQKVVANRVGTVEDMIGRQRPTSDIWTKGYEGVIQMFRTGLFRAVYKDKIGHMAYPAWEEKPKRVFAETPFGPVSSQRPTSTATSGALEHQQDNQPPIRPGGVVPYPFSRPVERGQSTRTGTGTVGRHQTSERRSIRDGSKGPVPSSSRRGQEVPARGHHHHRSSPRASSRGPSDGSTDRQNRSSSIIQLPVQDEAADRGKQGSASGRRSPPSGAKGPDRKRSKK